MADDLERRGLQEAADVHRLRPAVGQDPLPRWPSGDDGRDQVSQVQLVQPVLTSPGPGCSWGFSYGHDPRGIPG
ncbi:hypothetical protein [Nocardioides pantholopis]|uniref:hypothetical protein n=1 Tax=Nocardioides pantholopis TaxID=2483798 RepID=UPI0013E28671|nr:hypothetical protein [Nocardioides pantholopis]